MPTHEQRLAGRVLRYHLTILLLDASRPVTTAELASAIIDSGFHIGGRPSKAVSDALRWEVRRGRVRRVARSVYVSGTIPPTTARWMRWWLVTQSAGHSIPLAL